MTSYYALWHDPRRSQLTLHYDTEGRVDGFLTIAQTGADLFVPLVTLAARDARATGELLRAALAPNRSYRAIVPLRLAPALAEHLDVDQAGQHSIHRLDVSRFEPVLNVLVQRVTGADGSPRFQIEAQGQVVAMAGTNWRSPVFAEVFVYVHPSGRGRGWGRSVVSACTLVLLEEHLQPLYVAEETDQASRQIAEAVGYADTGAREFEAICQLKPG